MFAYEKGLIWGNDNYRTNGSLVILALATGNSAGRRRMRAHGRPSGRLFATFGCSFGRPAPYVDKLLIEGKGGVHHIWGCDHYKRRSMH